MTFISASLTGVPETMMWTLHARASAARKVGGLLDDPRALRIYDALEYDFKRSFGPANPLFAVRAALMDRALRAWLRKHPDGQVVSLGEGLETQFWRVDNGKLRWLSVDLPDAMQVRNRLLPAEDRMTHLATSATEPEWMDAVTPQSPLFIVAQGLFMYLQPEVVQRLFTEIGRRFPGATLIFDIAPRWLSISTMRGHRQTDSYVLPPMPWGLDRNEVKPTLRSWSPSLRKMRMLPYRWPNKWSALGEAILDRIRPYRRHMQSMVQVTF